MDNQISYKISKKLSQVSLTSKTSAKIEDFSEREIEIMKMMLRNYSNRTIADACFITEGTVKNYITSIYRKLNTSDRKQAVTLLSALLNDVQLK